MSKISKHANLVALSQMPASALTAEDVAELQRQLRVRLDREMETARDEAIRDLLDFSSAQLRECSEAAKAVVRAHDAEGEDLTEAAEEAYFLQHPQVLELYLPRHLGD